MVYLFSLSCFHIDWLTKMNLIRLSIERPTAIVAMVLMIVLFGWVSLQKVPIQMAPDVRQPVIIIKTNWRGAAPSEIEREIVTKK